MREPGGSKGSKGEPGGSRGGGGLLTSVIIIVRFACLLSAPAHNQRLRLEPFPLNPTKAVVILSSHGKSCQRSPIPAEVLSTTSYQVAIRLTLSLTLNWSHRMKRSDYDGGKNYYPFHSPDQNRIMIFWLSLISVMFDKANPEETKHRKWHEKK